MANPNSTTPSLSRFIYTTIRNSIFGPPNPTSPSPAPMAEHEEPTRSVVHEPGNSGPFLADVFEMKSDLCRGLKLPMEIVNIIADYAEYWPHTSTRRYGGTKTIRAGPGQDEDQLILRSYPLGYLPRKEEPNHPTECRMPDEASFPTRKPHPWSTIKPVQGDATEQIRSKWLSDSQIHGCRKIVFTIRSHDQGWGGERDHHGTYKGSYSWFDVGKEELVAYKPGQKPSTLPEGHIHVIDEMINEKEKVTCAFQTTVPATESDQTSSGDLDITYNFRHALCPDPSCLQRNVTASRNFKEHKIVWSCDDNIHPESTGAQALEDIGRGPATGTGEFVRNLKIGDVVTLWAKARFGGWSNTIEDVKIEIYWAV